VKFDNKVSADVKEDISNELKDWERAVEGKKGVEGTIETNLEDY
jgi:hypothetical protein